MAAPQLKQDVVLNVVGLDNIRKLEQKLRKVQRMAKEGVDVRAGGTASQAKIAAKKRETVAERELTVATKQQTVAEQQASLAAKRSTRSTTVETAAIKENTRAKRQNVIAGRAVAGASGVLGGSTRTVASSAAYHSKSLGLFGLFAGLAAIRGLFAGIVAPAAKFEKQLAMVRKTTKLTKDETAAYGEDLLKLSSRLAITREDLADISIVAGQMGVRGTRNLLEFTETVARMSEVAEISAERAAAGIAQISVSFNLPIDAANNMGSVLNELGNNTTANAAKILAALSKIGPAAEILGLSLSDTAAMAATLIHGGFVPSRAGTSLRSMLVRLQTRSAEVASVLKISTEEFQKGLAEDTLPTLLKLFATIKNLGSEQADVLKNIFGERHFVAIQLLADKTELLNENIEIGNRAFAEGTSLIEEHARKVDNLATRWDRFTGAIGNAMTKMGTTISPALSKLLDTLTPTSAQTAGFLEGKIAEMEARRAEIEATASGEYAFGGISKQADMEGVLNNLEHFQDAYDELIITTQDHERVSQRLLEIQGRNGELQHKALTAEGSERRKINRELETTLDLEKRLKTAYMASKPEQRVAAAESVAGPFDISKDPELERQFRSGQRSRENIRLIQEENNELKSLKRRHMDVVRAMHLYRELMHQLPQDTAEYKEMAGALGEAMQHAGSLSQSIAEIQSRPEFFEEQTKSLRMFEDEMAKVRDDLDTAGQEPFIPEDDFESILRMGELVQRLDALTPIENLFREGSVRSARDNLERVRAEVERLEKLMEQSPDDLDILEAYTEAREAQVDAEVEFFNVQQDRVSAMSRGIVDVVRDLKTMANTFGDLGEDVNNFVSSLIVGIETAAQLVQEVRKLKASGGGMSFGAVSAGLGLVSGLAGMAGSIIGAIKSDAKKARAQRDEAIRVSKENQRRLEESIRALYEQTQVGEDISGELVEGLEDAFHDLEQAWLNIDPSSEWFVADPKEREQFETKYRFAKDRINALLAQMDIAPIDFSRGFSHWERTLTEILDGLLVNQGQYQKSVEGVIASMEFLSQFVTMDIEDSFTRFVDGLSNLESVPEWLLNALGGIDLSTDEGKDILNQLLSDWAEAITSGEIDFGGLTPNELEDIMSFLSSLTRDGDASVVNTTTSGLNDLVESLNYLSRFIDLDVVTAFARFTDGLTELEDVPDWVQSALSDLDLSTPEGQQALQDLLGTWAEALVAGGLDLGGLSEGDFNNLMDFLSGLTDGSFGEDGSDISTLSVSRSITDVQANAVVLLLEQLVFWNKSIAQQMGVSGDFVSTLAPVPTGKTGPIIDPTDPGYIGIVEGDHGGPGTGVKVGDVHVNVQANPDDVFFADAVAQAVATKIRRNGVRRI